MHVEYRLTAALEHLPRNLRPRQVRMWKIVPSAADDNHCLPAKVSGIPAGLSAKVLLLQCCIQLSDPCPITILPFAIPDLDSKSEITPYLIIGNLHA